MSAKCYIFPDPGVRAKVYPHVNRTRTRTPHPAPAPGNRTSPNVSPQVFPTTPTSKFATCFFGTTVLQSLSRCRPFFPAGKNPYFLQAGKQPYFKAIFKESSSKSFCTRFLTKKVKVRKKKETFAFLEVEKKNFFSPQSAVENKTHFFLVTINF
jgi:hypothetical protein